MRLLQIMLTYLQILVTALQFFLGADEKNDEDSDSDDDVGASTNLPQNLHGQLILQLKE